MNDRRWKSDVNGVELFLGSGQEQVFRLQVLLTLTLVVPY